MNSRYWCEFYDWADKTSYWSAYSKKPNWITMTHANRIITVDESNGQYVMIKDRYYQDSTVVPSDEMQWIILQSQSE